MPILDWVGGDGDFGSALWEDAQTGTYTVPDASDLCKVGNYAALTVSSGSSFIVLGLRTNGGLTVNGSLSTLSDGVSLQGSLELGTSGTLTAEYGTVSGAFTSRHGSLLDVTNGAFVMSGGGEVDGSLETSGGGIIDFDGGAFVLATDTVSGAGAIKVSGNADVDVLGDQHWGSALFGYGGTLEGTGTLTLTQGAIFGTTGGSSTEVESGSGTTLLLGNSTILLEAAVDLDGNRVLENTGTLDWHGGNINLGVKGGTTGATVKNDVGGVINITGYSAGVASHQRHMTSSGSGTNSLINLGLLEQTGSYLTTIEATLTNSGTVIATAGTLQLDAGGTSTGSLQASGGGILDFNGGTFGVSGTVTGSGTVAISGGTTTLTSGSDLTSLSNLKLTGGTLAVNTLQSFGGTFVGSGGTLSVASAETFTLTGTNTLASTVGGVGTLLIAGGVTTLNLGSHLTTLSALTVSGGTLAVATPQTFAGALTETAGILSIGTGETFTLTGTDVFAGTVSGAGTLSLTGGTTTLQTGAALSTGRLKLSGGATALSVSTNLAYGGALVGNGGTVSIGTGDTFTLAGNNTLASTIGGAGTLAIGGGTTTLNVGSHLNTLAALNLSGGTLKVNTAQTVSGSFQGSGGTVSIVTGDTFTLSGTASLATAVSGGGTLAVGGGTTSLNLGSHLTNLSNLRLTGGTLAVATPQTFAGTFVGNGGTLTIAVGDTFTLTGTDTIASTIGGSGTLVIGGGTTTLNLGTHLSGLAALKLSSSGTLTIATPLTFAGTLTEAAGTTLALGANKFTLTGASSTLNGAVTGTGTLGLGSGVSLHLGGTVSSTETVALTGTDRLLLSSPTGFGATIAGLDSTDGLDFINFAPGSTSVGFVENAGHTAGVLTVKNGSTRITLNLKGNYASGTFLKGTDGASGTLVTYTPAGGGNAFQPAHVPPIGTIGPVFRSPSPTLVIGGQRATAPGASGTNLGISLATMFGGGLRTTPVAQAAHAETFGRDPLGHILVGVGGVIGHGRSSLGLPTIAAYHSVGSS